MNHYETVFILNPVLSEEQTKETVLKYEKFLTSKGAKMVSKEDWGLKKLAYPIQNKKSGFYHLFEYTVEPTIISWSRDQAAIESLVGINQSLYPRIIITPQHAKKLSKALNDNIKRFEDNFGSIKDYDNPKFQMNFGPTGKA